MILAGLALIIYANKSGRVGPVPANEASNQKVTNKAAKKKNKK
jgi:hypothetical protein